ncbi:MAG: DUF4271 domain-containing protein [Bacteroidales bacterium]|nr:DUF4271 domain-containing protein [Bacteroidales bacterium]
MRTRYLILLILLSVTVLSYAAPPKKTVSAFKGDSTSYIYYHPLTSLDCFYWENGLRIAKPIPQITVSPKVDSLSMRLVDDTAALFTLPDVLPPVRNSLYTFEINETEYTVGIPTDKTSYIYQQRKRYPFTHADSVLMYVPLNMKNLSRFTLAFYGINAWQIDIENPPSERFYFDLNKSKSELEFPEGMLAVFVLSLVLILLANFFSNGYISRLLLIVFYYNAFNNTVGERNISADKAGYMLFVNYILNVVLFSVIALTKYGHDLPFSFLLALAIGCATVVVVYLVKFLVSLLLSNLFMCKDTFSLHYSNVSYIAQLLGVVMLPLNFCMVYIGYDITIETLFVVCVSACILAEMLKLFRLCKIIFDKHFSKFYLFLYLCGVEFLPVLLAVKILSR